MEQAAEPAPAAVFRGGRVLTLVSLPQPPQALGAREAELADVTVLTAGEESVDTLAGEDRPAADRAGSLGGAQRSRPAGGEI
jgi:hypothetical protein